VLSIPQVFIIRLLSLIGKFKFELLIFLLKTLLKLNIISENNVLAINKYNQNNTKTVKTIIKYFFVSILVGHTTCLNSLNEPFKNLIIK
jgi:hypothetical protein